MEPGSVVDGGVAVVAPGQGVGGQGHALQSWTVQHFRVSPNSKSQCRKSLWKVCETWTIVSIDDISECAGQSIIPNWFTASCHLTFILDPALHICPPAIMLYICMYSLFDEWMWRSGEKNRILMQVSAKLTRVILHSWIRIKGPRFFLHRQILRKCLFTYYCSKRMFLKITISGTRISSRDGNKQITERVKICLIMCLILRMIISRCSQNFSAVIPFTMIVSDHIYWYIVDCKYEDSWGSLLNLKITEQNT